jgi:dipeptidyl aminopeptidase/acylaminoacyl peptidase
VPQQFYYDAEQVLNFVKHRIGVKGKIGVYGRSLGGIAACYLQDQVDMVICDRGFCDLWTLAEKKFSDKLTSSLMKYGTKGWQVQNAYNYLRHSPNNTKPCYKVIMCDLADEIIDVHCSLMVGVAN